MLHPRRGQYGMLPRKHMGQSRSHKQRTSHSSICPAMHSLASPTELEDKSSTVTNNLCVHAYWNIMILHRINYLASISIIIIRRNHLNVYCWVTQNLMKCRSIFQYCSRNSIKRPAEAELMLFNRDHKIHYHAVVDNLTIWNTFMWTDKPSLNSKSTGVHPRGGSLVPGFFDVSSSPMRTRFGVPKW
jgi:hypothetical protein